MTISDGKDKNVLHKSLSRILNKHSLDLQTPPKTEKEWKDFLYKVNQLLSSNDEDRYLLERSFDVTSQDMQKLIDESHRKYQSRIDALLKIIPDMIFYLDEDGKYIDLISMGSREHLQKPFHISQGEHINKIFSKESADAIQQANRRAIESGELITIESKLEDSSGKHKFLEIRIMPTSLKENGQITSVVIVRDITLEKKSLFYYQMIRKVFEDAREGIFIISSNLEYIEYNRAFMEIFGFEKDEKPPLDYDSYASFFDEDEFKDMQDKISETGSFKGEITIKRRDGTEVLAFSSVSTIKPSKGVAGYRLAIVTDITELKKSREELYYTATHDALTGLPNRKYILENIGKSIKRLSREKKQGALIFIDLDNFKSINDLLGHKAGDELLNEVAKRVKSRIRSSDLFGRLAGDEFILFIENIEEADHIANLAQTIIDILTFPFEIGGSEHRIGASIGIAMFPDDTDDIETLLQYADRAMYEAKECGKNRYNFYNSKMKHNIKEFRRIERILERALKHRGLCLYYQPQFEIQTGRVIGIEVLVRIDQRIGGGLGPKEFIPVAKESGLIVPLGRWILEEAFKQISKWQNIYNLDSICTSLNVSDRQIMDERWADEVSLFIDRYNINPNLVEFEITEDMLMQSKKQGFRTLKKLRKLGCRLALDDFGTGLMSLSNLEPDMIHRIKIDQSFISRLHSDKSAKRIIKASISLAHSIGLLSIAEGVENSRQREELISLECDQAQGFLLSSPLDDRNVLRFMLEHSAGFQERETGKKPIVKQFPTSC